MAYRLPGGWVLPLTLQSRMSFLADYLKECGLSA